MTGGVGIDENIPIGAAGAKPAFGGVWWYNDEYNDECNDCKEDVTTAGWWWWWWWWLCCCFSADDTGGGGAAAAIREISNAGLKYGYGELNESIGGKYGNCKLGNVTFVFILAVTGPFGFLLGRYL